MNEVNNFHHYKPLHLHQPEEDFNLEEVIIQMDVEKFPELETCDEIITIPRNDRGEVSCSVIDLDKQLNTTSDILIINEQEQLKNLENSVLDMAEINDSLTSSEVDAPTINKLKRMVLDFKTYDLSLKILSNTFKTLGMKEAALLTKQVRGVIKYIQAVELIKDGKINLDPSKFIYSAAARKEWVGSVFTSSGLLADTLTALSEGLKSGKFTEYVNDYKTNVEMISQAAGMPVASLKLFYKLFSFEAALDHKDQKPNEATPHAQTIVILRSGLEAVREVTKMALLLTGYSHPAIFTTLAVAGIVTGSAGLYLLFNK